MAVIACQLTPTVRAQSAHFSGVQTIVPTSSMNHPTGIAVDANGNLYISDNNNHRILKETLSGGAYTESIVANSSGATAGVAVDAIGNFYYFDTATNTTYKETPSGSTYTQSIVPTSAISSGASYLVALAVDSNGNVYISDPGNNRVLKETLSGAAYTESTVGSGLSFPVALAVDAGGDVYISDTINDRLLKETLSGGTYTQSLVVPSGLATEAIAVDATGNVFVADFANNRALKETLSGGSYTQSIIPTNSLNNPYGIAVDSSGNVYISQASNPISGILKEWAPTTSANFGTVNVGSPSSAMTLFFTFDSAGTIAAPGALTQGTANLDYTDAGTGTCTTNGTSHNYNTGDTCGVDTIFTPRSPGPRYGAGVLQNSAGYTIATAYIQGTGSGPKVNFPPGVLSTPSFGTIPNNPYAIAVDAAGNLYLALAVSINSPQNAVVKETWTGSGYTQSTIKSGLAYPVGVAVDGAGNVYIADQDAGAVYKMAPSGTGYSLSSSISGIGSVEAIAADGGGNFYIGTLAAGLLVNTLTTHGYVQSTISSGVYPFGIAVDGQGNVYLSDSSNNQVLKMAPGHLPSPIITGLNGPHGIAVDGNGNLYIAQPFGGGVVKETLSGGAYTQSTLLSGVSDPIGVAVDASGNVFASSDAANAVWKIDFADPPSLTFSATTVGLISGSQTVTVQNVGNAALSFPIPATGNNPSIATNFSLNSSGASACPLVTSNSSAAGPLAASNSCQLPISFAPIASGSITGSLTLTNNNLNAVAPAYATQTIALSGTANGPDLTSTTVTASSTSIVFGQSTTLNANVVDPGNTGVTPSGSVTFSDTVGGTNTPLGTVALSAGTATLTYTPASAGSHTITVSYTSSTPATFQNSTSSLGVTVTPATPVITWATPANITYGAALSATQLNATANVPGAFVYTPAAGAIPTAGTTSLSVTFTPTDTVNYATATKSVSLQINQQATATALTLSGTSIVPNQSLTLTAKVTGVSSGTPTGTVTFLDATTVLGTAALTGGSATYSTTSLLSGSHNLTATYSGDTNYSASSTASSSTVAVGPLDFSISVSGAASQTVTRGGSANLFLTVTPTYGTYPAAVTFTASGLPSGASATFTPSTLSASAGPQTVGLTIQTSLVAANDNLPLHRGGAPLILALLVLPIAGAGRWKRAGQRLRTRIMLVFWLIVAAVATTGLSGCSIGSGGTNSQSYTVTVTATAGSVQHTATVSLTVQ